jgi:hypothetical protein
VQAQATGFLAVCDVAQGGVGVEQVADPPGQLAQLVGVQVGGVGEQCCFEVFGVLEGRVGQTVDGGHHDCRVRRGDVSRSLCGGYFGVAGGKDLTRHTDPRAGRSRGIDPGLRFAGPHVQHLPHKRRQTGRAGGDRQAAPPDLGDQRMVEGGELVAETLHIPQHRKHLAVGQAGQRNGTQRLEGGVEQQPDDILSAFVHVFDNTRSGSVPQQDSPENIRQN